MMLDDRMKKDYQSVSAPKELKSQLMNEFSGQKIYRFNKSYRHIKFAAYAFAITAMLLLVTIVGLNNKSASVKIHILGNTVSDNPMVARYVENDSKTIIIPMWVEMQKKATITVSSGRMQIYDSDTKEIVYEGNEWTGKGTYLIQWEFLENDISDYRIIINSHGRKITYTLKCEENQWSLEK